MVDSFGVLVVAGATAVGAIIGGIGTVLAARAKSAEDRRASDRGEARDERDLIATEIEQWRATYTSLIDTLRADVADLRAQLATERLERSQESREQENQIRAQENRIQELEREVEGLRETNATLQHEREADTRQSSPESGNL